MAVLTMDEKIEWKGVCVHPFRDTGVLWYVIRNMDTNDFWDWHREGWVSSLSSATMYDLRKECLTDAMIVALADCDSEEWVAARKQAIR